MALSAGTRRTVACLLVGLGALLIVAALMIPTYTVDKLAKTPSIWRSPRSRRISLVRKA